MRTLSGCEPKRIRSEDKEHYSGRAHESGRVSISRRWISGSKTQNMISASSPIGLSSCQAQASEKLVRLSITDFLKSAPDKLAYLKFARLIFASFRFASFRFASFSFASFSFASFRFALTRFASIRFASIRFAPFSFARLRSAPFRFAPLKSASERSACLNLAFFNETPFDLERSKLARYTGRIQFSPILVPFMTEHETSIWSRRMP